MPPIDPVKLIGNLKGALVILLVTLSTILCFAPVMVLAVLKLLIPMAPVRRRVTRWLMAIGEVWVSFNSLLFSIVGKTTWDVRGVEELSREDWFLVVSNHQTWVDIVALQTVFSRKIPFLKFFIKQKMIWFPFLGLVWWAMDMPFMKRHSKSYLAAHPEKKGIDLESTRRACEKFSETPTSVINFIEGTRFTPEKRVAGGSEFENLLPPRAGGMALALSSMGSMFSTILDVTIVYPGAPATFWELVCGEIDHIIIEVVKRPVEEWTIVGDYAGDSQFRGRFQQWLTELWTEKDAKIDALKEDHGRPLAC